MHIFTWKTSFVTKGCLILSLSSHSMDPHQKKMASLLLVPAPSPKFSLISISKQQNIMKFIISICFMAANILSILPCDYINRNRIPSIIFRGLSSNLSCICNVHHSGLVHLSLYLSVFLNPCLWFKLIIYWDS